MMRKYAEMMIRKNEKETLPAGQNKDAVRDKEIPLHSQNNEAVRDREIPPAGRNDRDYFACTFIYTLLEIFFAPLRLCESNFLVYKL